MSNATLEKIERLVVPIINNLGYRLVDVGFLTEHGRFILRLFIEKEAGKITIDDCALVSHAVEDAIETEGLLDMRYNLEVSSPGLDRPLKGKKDFEKYVGMEIKLKTCEPIDGRSNYKGLLEGVRDDLICIVVDGVKFEIPLNMVLKSNLVPKI